MASKKRNSPFHLLLGIVFVAGVIWITHDMVRGFDGTVTAKRSDGAHVMLSVRDASGSTFETRVPAAQGDDVQIGDRITKESFSRAIKFEKVVDAQSGD